MASRSFITRDELEALPEFRLGGETHVVIDPRTGISRLEREPQRFLVHNDMYWVTDDHGQVWSVFTDQDGKTWKQRAF